MFVLTASDSKVRRGPPDEARRASVGWWLCSHTADHTANGGCTLFIRLVALLGGYWKTSLFESGPVRLGASRRENERFEPSSSKAVVCILPAGDVMGIKVILEQLRAERSKIDSAIAALEEALNATGHRKARKRRKMSAAARAKIAAAQRARWAKHKRAAKA